MCHAEVASLDMSAARAGEKVSWSCKIGTVSPSGGVVTVTVPQSKTYVPHDRFTPFRSNRQRQVTDRCTKPTLFTIG